MEKFNCSYSKIVEIDSIIENPKNPNMHPPEQIQLLKKIIKYQGQRLPLVISKRSGFLVKGHGRLMAIKELGWTKVAIDEQDYESAAQEYADMVADNKIQELSRINTHDVLVDMVDEGIGLDFDFDLLGWENFDNILNPKETKNTGAELDLESFNDLQHKCPKCGFEFDDSTGPKNETTD